MTLPASNTRKRLKHASLALALEPRMMFDAAAVATAADVAVQVAATDVAPGVEATPANATVTVTDSTTTIPAVDLFGAVAVSADSANHELESLVVTVNSSGANQALVIDGTTIDLTTGPGVTETHKYAYTVAVNGDITTVTIALNSSADNTPADVANLIDNIAYQVKDSSIESGATTITLKSLSDDSDTATLNISATINLDNQINRPPVIGDAGIPDLAQSVTLADLGTSKEVVYSSDGKYLYAANASGTIVKFAVDANGALTSEQVFKDSTNLSSITDLALSSDGKSMYAISGSNIITLDVSDNGTLSYLNSTSGGGELQSVALSSDGKQVYVSTRVGGITVFTRDTATGELSGTGLPTLQEGALGGGRTRTIVSAGDYVFVASGTSLVTLQRDADGKLTKLSAGTLSTGIPTSITPSLTASADGSLIYIGDGSTIRIYALQGDGSGKTLVSLGSTSLAGVSALSVSGDGTKLYATSSSAGTLSVYSIGANGALSLTRTLNDVSGAGAVSLAPDGQSLVVAGSSLSRFSTTLSYINGSETRITDGLTLSDANLDRLANNAGNYQGASITIERSGGANGEDQFGFATASGLTLENNRILKNGVEIATFTESGGTLTITFTAAASSADANAVLQQITYSNTGNNVDGTLVRLNISASDGTLSSVAATVALLLTDNSAPTLGATVPVQPVYDTKGTVATLFKDASVNTGEVGQSIIEMKLSIDGLGSVANEFIIIDGTRIDLSTSSSNTTINGYSYVYSLTNGVGSLTISSASGISTFAAQALVNAIAYVNDSNQAVTGNRNVTLVTLRDNGGTANDGKDTGAPGLVANIVLAVNNAPVLQVDVDPDPTLFYSDGTLSGNTDYVTSVTLSTDGKTLYVTGSSGASLTGIAYIRVYARDTASGELTLLQTFTQGTGDDPNTTAIEVNGLNGANTLTVSPDGTSVYVAGYSSTGSATAYSLVLFTRDAANGALTYSGIVATQGEVNGSLTTSGLDTVVSEIVLSADGKSLYTINGVRANDGSTNKSEIAFFSRDPATGDLTFIGSYLGGTADKGLNQPTGLVVSADGTSVYVSNNGNAMITILKRDISTGILTYVAAVNQASISADPDSGVQPTDNRFLQNLQDIVISPDDQFLYVGSNAIGTISIFQRDVDGGLTYVGTVDTYNSKYTTALTMREMALSADGSALYVTTFGGQSVLVFARDATTGKLTFSESVNVGKSINHLAVSADGLNIYTGSSQVSTGVAILSARANTVYSDQHPTTFADGVSFADADFDTLSDYKGTVLTIVRSGTASVSDLFAFADGNDLRLENGKILYQDQAIADFMIDAGKLTVTFTASVDKTLANQVLKQVTYQNGDSTAPARVNLSVSIGDGGKSDSTVVVLLVNHAPVVSNDSYVPVTATVNHSYSVVLPEDLFKDAEGDVLTWQVDGLPSTLSFDPATRTVSGTPDSKGSYTITVTVTDTLGNSRDLQVTLTVAADPALAPVLSGDTTDIEYAGQTDGWSSELFTDVLSGAQDSVLSSDGKYLYVVSIPESGTSYLSQFSRAADGSLTLVRSLFDASLADGIAGLGGAIKVVLSADQQSLYVIGSTDNAVVVFSRDTSSGELALAGTLNGSAIAGGVDAIRDIVSVGGHVYIAAGDSLSVFSQQADGSLTLDKTYSDGADGMQGLASINRLQLSVDGQFLFVGGTGGNAIASALRIGADGVLTYLNSVGTGENYIGGLTVSADGKTLYAINNGTPGSLEAISIGSDGRLTLIGSSAVNLAGSDLVVSADGSAVFLVGEDTLKVFTRAADGTLTHYADVTDDGTEFGLSFKSLNSISLSNDGKQLYISDTGTSILFTMNVDLPRLDYTEGGSAGALLPSAHLSSPTLDVTGNYEDASISIVRDGGALADDLFTFLDGNGLTLDGSQIMKGGVAIATFVQANGELTVTFLAGSSQADAQNVLRQIAYANTSNDPERAGATPDFSVTFDDGAGNSTVLEVGVDLHGVNDPSVLISTPLNPDLAENGEGVKLFNGTQIDTIETDQTIWKVFITVDASGPNEVLRVDGSNIVLQTTNGTPKTASGIQYSVLVENGVATLTIFVGRDPASTATLIDGITYNNTGSGLSGTRSIGLSITENFASGSSPTTVLADEVTVTLKPASTPNTAPVLAGPVPARPYTEGDSAIAIAPGATVTDAQMDALNGGAGNYSGATLTLTLGSGATSLDTLGFNAGNGLSLEGRTLLKDGVVIGQVTNTDGVLTIRFNDDAGTIPTTADVQNTLRQITYVSADHAPADSLAISVTLSDRFLTSSTMALSIDITPVNDTPVIVKDPVIALGDIQVTSSISTLGGLSSVTAISLSQDGSTLYAADNRGVIALFSRNATTGELTYLSTLPGGGELTSINRLLISADGQALYAIGAIDAEKNGVAIYSRDSSGVLRVVQTLSSQSDFEFYETKDIVQSPDGRSLYILGSTSLLVYSRDAGTGQLTQTQTLGDGWNAPYLWLPTAIDVSGDLVFVSTDYSNSLIAYRQGSDGQLTLLGFIRNTPTDPAIDNPVELGSLQHVAVSNDGRYVYIAGGDSVRLLSFDASNGSFTLIGVVASGLGDISDLVLSDDGAALFVSTANGTLNRYAVVDQTLILADTLQSSDSSTLGGAKQIVLDSNGNAIVVGQGLTSLSVIATPAPIYIIGTDPVILAPGLSLSDAELDAANAGAGNYQGASVSISRAPSADSRDHFGFADGDGLSLVNGQIFKGGAAIASLIDLNGTLTLTFTAQVSSADANAIFGKLTYATDATGVSNSSVNLNMSFSDAALTSQTRVVQITLRDPAANQSPIAGTTPYNLTPGTVGQNYSVTLPANLFNDPDGDTLTWQADVVPDGMSFDPATRILSGIPTGSGVLTLVVSDTAGLTATRTINFTVQVASEPGAGNPTPVIDSVSPVIPVDPVAWHTAPSASRDPVFDSSGRPESASSPSLVGEVAGNRPLRFTDNIGLDSFGQPLDFTQPDSGFTVFDTPLRTANGQSALWVSQTSPDGTTLSTNRERIGALLDMSGTSSRIDFQLPDGIFSSRDSQLTVSLRLSNGLPLPGWVSFDSRTGKIVVDRDRMKQAERLRLVLIARDASGKEARIPVELQTDGNRTLSLTPEQTPALQTAEPRSQASAQRGVSEQLQVASQGGLLARAQALLAALLPKDATPGEKSDRDAA
ncbi:beta-propeller fold lactonase family protein [Pseudomonas viridiflava]|uniref:beta-propeller fold lactonase family protein n=1 Tax=Pseudomonas viridiflava TaxID=33069 RepID=UPI0013C2A811|nr:beta-propeller fold lactonase family protein [Pseudomonas viridiflava]